MTVNIDTVLGALIEHMDRLQSQVNEINQILERLPKEMPPDITDDLKNLYSLCESMTKTDKVGKIVSKEVREGLLAIKSDWSKQYSTLSYDLQKQRHKVEEATKQMTSTFNRRDGLIGAGVAIILVLLFIGGGYGLSHYKNHSLVAHAEQQIQLANSFFKEAEDLKKILIQKEREAQKILDSQKILKTFVKNGNDIHLLACKHQSAIISIHNNRRVCTLHFWLQPQGQQN